MSPLNHRLQQIRRQTATFDTNVHYSLVHLPKFSSLLNQRIDEKEECVGSFREHSLSIQKESEKSGWPTSLGVRCKWLGHGVSNSGFHTGKGKGERLRLPHTIVQWVTKAREKDKLEGLG